MTFINQCCLTFQIDELLRVCLQCLLQHIAILSCSTDASEFIDNFREMLLPLLFNDRFFYTDDVVVSLWLQNPAMESSW